MPSCPRCQWTTADRTGLAPGAGTLVSTVAVTDMPGRRSPRSGSFGSIAIFTGMRCTILVKFPVALSGGSSANSSPAGRRDAVDMAFDGRPRIGVDHDTDRRALADAGKLSFLEIRDHINRSERHHGHELGASLHVFSNTQAAVTDDAVDRRNDIGIAKVQLRLLLHGLIMLQGRFVLGELRLQHADLFLGGRNRSRIARQRGLRGVALRCRLLCHLHAGAADFGEAAETRVLLLRVGQIGLVDRNGGAGLRDDGLLLLQGSRDVFNIGLRGCHVGLGLVEGRDIVAVIDLGERLVSFYRLIVFDQHMRSSNPALSGR